MYGMKNSSVCKSRFKLIIQASNTARIQGLLTWSNSVNVQLQAQSFNVIPYFDLQDKSDFKMHLQDKTSISVPKSVGLES